MWNNNLKIGIITNEISDNFEYALSIVKKMNLKYIELTNLWGKEIGDLKKQEVDKVKSLIEMNELEVSCISGWNFLGLPLWAKENVLTYDILTGWGSYDKHLDKLKKSIEIAHKLKTNVVRIFSFKTEAIFDDRIWKKLIEKFKNIVNIAESENIILAIETCPFCNMSTGYLAREVIEIIGSKHLRILWDPANSFYASGENPIPSEYHHIKEYIVHIHLKDFIMDRKYNKFECVPAGEGIMSIKELLELLIKEDYQGVISLEPEYIPENRTIEEGTIQFFNNLMNIFNTIEYK